MPFSTWRGVKNNSLHLHGSGGVRTFSFPAKPRQAAPAERTLRGLRGPGGPRGELL